MESTAAIGAAFVSPARAISALMRIYVLVEAGA
jgi:hypothetical protein